MIRKTLRFIRLCKSSGLESAIQTSRLRRSLRHGDIPTRIQPKFIDYGVTVRPRTSDAQVFGQIFLDREYACLDRQPQVDLILDCGANVGYSSAYFLSRFPNSRVVAIEPDPGNFEALKRNLAPYGSRARLVRAGIWSHPAPLVVSEETYRDGREWARQVRPARPGEPVDLRGIDIGTLLAETDAERLSILKMDIEGAEAVVFADGAPAWLDRVDTIAIELHDDTAFGDASRVFREAIRGKGFEVSHSGELTICRRPVRHA